ncbi:MAG TPA: FkbM family methyltransferase [Tepidisphaeraceae bacterium]|nr:FkbM family methyltransferase [Tepidisphaeraceae bacterium]
MSIRSVAERACAPFILRRRMPMTFGGGRMYVCTRNGGLRYLRRNLQLIDPALLDVVDEFVKPGMTVWDIGANVGLFTFAAANRVTQAGSVLAVDADIDNVRLLLRSREAMNLIGNGRVDILPAAVAGERMPFATFEIARRSRCTNALTGLGGSQMGGVRETRTVPAYTLDQLLESFPQPRFVKIDIEGAELIALRGATRLLADIRPIFCTEVSGFNQAEVSELFKRHRYRLFDFDKPRADRKEESLVPWNALAIPQ